MREMGTGSRQVRLGVKFNKLKEVEKKPCGCLVGEWFRRHSTCKGPGAGP